MSLGILPLAYGSEETVINVSIVGDPVIELNSDNFMIRASIQVVNYDPGDGHYFMQIIQASSGKIIIEEEILIRERGNEMWGTEVGSMINKEQITQNDRVVLGDYKVRIFTEYGISTGSAAFSVIESDSSQVEQPLVVSSSSTQTNPVDATTSENPTQETQENLQGETEPKIPTWVRNIFIWYAEKRISEDELLGAIQFLIDQGILRK